MARTIRSREIYKKHSCFRTPRHSHAIRCSKDEYGIRKGAIPKTDYDDIDYASIKEDWVLKNTFTQVTRNSSLDSFYPSPEGVGRIKNYHRE